MDPIDPYTRTKVSSKRCKLKISQTNKELPFKWGSRCWILISPVALTQAFNFISNLVISSSSILEILLSIMPWLLLSLRSSSKSFLKLLLTLARSYVNSSPRLILSPSLLHLLWIRPLLNVSFLDLLWCSGIHSSRWSSQIPHQYPRLWEIHIYNHLYHLSTTSFWYSNLNLNPRTYHHPTLDLRSSFDSYHPSFQFSFLGNSSLSSFQHTCWWRLDLKDH